MRSRTIAGLGVVLALSVTMTATPALAKDGDVIRRGSCSGPANWKVKASPQNGRIEVEGEVDANRNGQVWRWRLLHNKSLSSRGTSTTHAPSGSFSVRRLTVDLQGTDTFKFVATRPSTGEVCRGSVQF